MKGPFVPIRFRLKEKNYLAACPTLVRNDSNGYKVKGVARGVLVCTQSKLVQPISASRISSTLLKASRF